MLLCFELFVVVSLCCSVVVGVLFAFVDLMIVMCCCLVVSCPCLLMCLVALFGIALCL